MTHSPPPGNGRLVVTVFGRTVDLALSENTAKVIVAALNFRATLNEHSTGKLVSNVAATDGSVKFHVEHSITSERLVIPLWSAPDAPPADATHADPEA